MMPLILSRRRSPARPTACPPALAAATSACLRRLMPSIARLPPVIGIPHAAALSLLLYAIDFSPSSPARCRRRLPLRARRRLIFLPILIIFRFTPPIFAAA